METIRTLRLLSSVSNQFEDHAAHHERQRSYLEDFIRQVRSCFKSGCSTRLACACSLTLSDVRARRPVICHGRIVRRLAGHHGSCLMSSLVCCPFDKQNGPNSIRTTGHMVSSLALAEGRTKGRHVTEPDKQQARSYVCVCVCVTMIGRRTSRKHVRVLVGHLSKFRSSMRHDERVWTSKGMFMSLVSGRMQRRARETEREKVLVV
jgi:hypothetical protein